jgi:hypothetical protein
MNKHQSQLPIRINLSSPLTLISLFGVAAFAVGCSTLDLTETTPISAKSANSATQPPPKPKYVRPKVADNGAPFPTQSGYVNKYPVRFTDGYSTVTVDNSKNNSDVFVKLFSLNSKPEQPIRVFFIRAHDTFTAETVRAGNYDLRYRDLDSGALSRTQTLNLEEVQTATGTQFSRLRLTLYKVANGKMKTYPISEQEF